MAACVVPGSESLLSQVFWMPSGGRQHGGAVCVTGRPTTATAQPHRCQEPHTSCPLRSRTRVRRHPSPVAPLGLVIRGVCGDEHIPGAG